MHASPSKAGCGHAAKQRLPTLVPQPQKRRQISSYTSPPVIVRAAAITKLLDFTEDMSQVIAWLDAGSLGMPAVTVHHITMSMLVLAARSQQHCSSQQIDSDSALILHAQ